MFNRTPLPSKFGIEGLLEQERWELRNEEGDVIRLDDWEDMVGPDSKIHLVNNRENEPTASEDWGRPYIPPYASRTYGEPLFSQAEEREFSTPPPRPSTHAHDRFYPSMHGTAAGGGVGGAGGIGGTPRPRVPPKQHHQEEFESMPGERFTRSASTAPSDTNSFPSSASQSERPQSIVICAYSRLKVPTLYPPTQAKVVKCSFGPATPYWRALKALSEGNVTNNTRLQILHIRYNQDREKVLVQGRTVIGSRDLTLQELGFGDLEDGQEMTITRFV